MAAAKRMLSITEITQAMGTMASEILPLLTFSYHHKEMHESRFSAITEADFPEYEIKP